MGKKLVAILGNQSGRMTALGLLVTLTVTMVLSGWMLSYQTNAAVLTQFKDTMDESAPSSLSNHTLRFTVSNAIPAGGSISITFDSGFNFNALEFGDVDIASGGGDYTIAAAAAAQVMGVTFQEAGQKVLIAIGAGINIESAEVLTIEIGTNATFGTAGDALMTNPSNAAPYTSYIYTNSYNVANQSLDNGTTAIALVDGVTLNATVDAVFRFVVDGVDTGGLIDSYAVSSASSANYVGFGSLTAGTPVMMGSSLSASSNAQYGFVVTVSQDHNMISSSSADIDCFKDGTCSSTGTAWTTPLGTIGLEDTYGHLGVHSEDGSNTIANAASVSSATNGDWFGMTSNVPIEVWDVSTSADGATQDIGHIDVGYRIQTAAPQAFGRYNNRLTYIATPTF